MARIQNTHVDWDLIPSVQSTGSTASTLTKFSALVVILAVVSITATLTAVFLTTDRLKNAETSTVSVMTTITVTVTTTTATTTSTTATTTTRTTSTTTTVNAIIAPTYMVAYRGNNGQTYNFLVTGSSSSGLWGTTIYTDDSTISVAVVHAGLLQVGQTGVIIVTVLAGQSSYTGSTQNGITSSSYGSWAGSYSLASGGG